MPRLVTREQLRDRSLERADMVNDTFVTAAYVNDLINVYLTELYDELVEASPPDYYSEDVVITTIPNQLSYDLPDDFRSLVQVYAIESTLWRRPLSFINDVDRINFKPPQAAVQLSVRYIPAPPVLETDDDPVTGTFDGVSGWDNLIVMWVARAMLARDRKPTPDVDAEIQHMLERIRANARKRHAGMANTMQDVESIGYWPYPYGSSVDAYQLRKNQLDIYTLSPTYP